MPWYLQKEPKLKYIPSSVSLLHVLDFPPVSAGHSSKWLKYLNEKKSKCKTKVYRLNVTLTLLKHVKWENSQRNFLHVLILGHPSVQNIVKTPGEGGGRDSAYERGGDARRLA